MVLPNIGYAGVMESVDMHAWGVCGSNAIGVQVPSPAFSLAF